MEPSEIGLLLGAETCHSLHEDMRGRHSSQMAGLLLTLLRARDHDTDQSTCSGGHTTATKRPQWVGLWSSDTIVAPRPAPSLHTRPMRGKVSPMTAAVIRWWNAARAGLPRSLRGLGAGRTHCVRCVERLARQAGSA